MILFYSRPYNSQPSVFSSKISPPKSIWKKQGKKKMNLFAASFYTLLCFCLCVFSQPLRDCANILGKNATWAMYGGMTQGCETGYALITKDNKLASYSYSDELLANGTFELSASENGDECYMIQTITDQNGDSFQQCVTYSVTMNGNTMAGCIVKGIQNNLYMQKHGISKKKTANKKKGNKQTFFWVFVFFLCLRFSIRF